VNTTTKKFEIILPLARPPAARGNARAAACFNSRCCSPSFEKKPNGNPAGFNNDPAQLTKSNRKI